MIERNFDLFLNAGKALPLLINVNQYDHGEKWIFTLYNDDGTQYIPSTGAIVGVKADGFGIINSGSIEDGKVVIMETEQMTAAVGKATFELMIDSQTHGTANFNVLVEAKPGNNATYSDSDVSLIQEAVDATSPLPTGGTVGQVLTKTAQGSAWSDAGTPTQAQVAEAVSDWADEHITVETGVVIDNSLSVAGAAADSAKVGSEISELKSAVNSLAIPVINQVVPWTQGYIRTDGSDGDATNICRSVNMFTLPANVKVTVKDGFKVQLHEYSVLDDLTSFVKRLNATYLSGTNVFATEADKYYRFTVENTEETRIYYYDLTNDTVTWEGEPLYTDTTLSLSSKAANAKATGDAIGEIDNRFEYLNLFDTTTITEGTYLNTANGVPATLSSCFCSDFIDITKLTKVNVINTHIVCFYDSNKAFMSAPSSGDSRQSVLTLAKPAGAVYLRFSTFNELLNKAQVGENVTPSLYYSHSDYSLPDYVGKKEIIVDASGHGDYTSFTQAVKENLNNTYNIRVLSGTYDIKAEYVAIWGSEAVASMADSSSVFDGFQYGVILRNRTIVFESGARLVCDMTGNTIDGSHRFSPIRVDYNVEIIGMNLTCQHVFYAIHDDYGLQTNPYTVKYKNCVVNGENIVQQNVIGGGCQKYSRHIIENCYFSNGTNSNIHTARYHNTNRADAVPEIFVSNTYFNGTFTARWYGTQTSKMRVYVNNCKARAIYTMQEAEGYNTENVELFKWCNEETFKSENLQLTCNELATKSNVATMKKCYGTE